MSQVTQSHDAFFRSFMTDIHVARDFLQAYLEPALLAQCNMSTLRLENTSFISAKLRQRFSDILYSVKGREKGATIYAYMLIEHQHVPDELMPFRILEYQLDAMRRHIEQKRGKKLPTVVPLLFYQGKKSPYPFSTDIIDCFERPELAKKIFPAQIRLIDLTVTPDETLRKHQRAAVFETVMKHIHIREISTIFREILPLLVDYPPSVDKMNILLQYLTEKGRCDDDGAFLDLVTEHTKQYEEPMATLAQLLKQKGRREGIQEGLQQSLQVVAIKMLENHLAMDLISNVTGLAQEQIITLAQSQNIQVNPTIQ